MQKYPIFINSYIIKWNTKSIDDLKNLIYVLLFLDKGYLSWSYFDTANKFNYKNKVLNKQKFIISKFCDGDFNEILIIFKNK